MALVLILGSVAAPAVATNYYVSETGSDTENDGKSESAPFRTPEHAFKQATTAWDNVYVMKGVYKLSETPQIRQSNIALYGHKATRDEIVFDGQGKVRCLQFVTNASGEVSTVFSGFRMSGVTFRNGYSEVKGNYANWNGQGAGVWLTSNTGTAAGQKVEIANCVFEGCTNRYNNGGGLCFSAAGSVVSNCVFRKNMTRTRSSQTPENAPMGGGAGAYVLCWSGDSATFTHCTFEDNTATNGIAAIGAGSYQNNWGAFTNGIGVIVKHCTFIRNRSVNSGSYCVSAGCLSPKVWLAEDCTFVSNCADRVSGSNIQPGGGVFTSTLAPTPSRTNTFRRCTFRANGADGNGGVFYYAPTTKMPLVFDACTFAMNYTSNQSGNGACIYAINAPVMITDCVATGNYIKASQVWHGIFNLGGGSYVARSQFIRNADKGYNGVVNLRDNSEIENCSFINNTHSSGQTYFGFLMLYGKNCRVRNCLFAGNTSDSGVGSALCVNSTGARIENCTFVNNKTTSATTGNNDGTAIAASYSATVVNSLFVNNVATKKTIGQLSAQIASSDVSFCWADTAGTVSAGENGNLPVGDGKAYFDTKSEYAYLPTPRTPGFNKAQKLDWMESGLDIYGARRISGSGPDFGCIERQLKGLVLIFR